VQELQVEAWRNRKARMRTLHISFVHTARKHRFRFAMADTQNAKISFGSALVRTIFLARRLRKTWAGQKMLGVLLPPSVPGALVNFAAMLSGKVPVNLNYTVSEETLASCIRQCGIKTVTPRRPSDKIKLKVPAKRCRWKRSRRTVVQRNVNGVHGVPDAGPLESGGWRERRRAG
jgi:acyl-[acyl-carrier-protein]-phospholipid O-acyltransferase/long-chain-fatty-acid--[acyl-carrier-protein] ligase